MSFSVSRGSISPEVVLDWVDLMLDGGPVASWISSVDVGSSESGGRSGGATYE